MHFIKLETSDQDVRWVNLEQVSRVTIGDDSSGVPFAAIVFADGNVDESLKIHGRDEVNRQAIETLVMALNQLSDGKP